MQWLVDGWNSFIQHGRASLLSGDGAFAQTIISILFLGFGIVIGQDLGEKLGQKCLSKKQYWLSNLGVFLAGIIISAVVTLLPSVIFPAFTIGMLAGAIAGLKFGFGESVGPWRFHDEKLRVNKDHLRAAKTGSAARWRRRKKFGEKEPELMSVDSGAKDKHAGKEKEKK